jgi:hypothetical protein
MALNRMKSGEVRTFSCYGDGGGGGGSSSNSDGHARDLGVRSGAIPTFSGVRMFNFPPTAWTPVADLYPVHTERCPVT